MARRRMPRSPRSPTSSIVTSANSSEHTRLQGIAAAPGQAFAPAWRWKDPSLENTAAGPTGELGADELKRAIEQVKVRLSATTARLHASGASAGAGILAAQILMLEDPALLEGARELVIQGTQADLAVAATMAPFAAMLRASPDPVFQARAADVDDVVEQLRRALHGLSDVPPLPSQPSIVVARPLPFADGGARPRARRRLRHRTGNGDRAYGDPRARAWPAGRRRDPRAGRRCRRWPAPAARRR